MPTETLIIRFIELMTGEPNEVIFDDEEGGDDRVRTC